MADDDTRNADSASGADARHNLDTAKARTPDRETLRTEAHRAGVEAVARALDQPAV